VPGNDRPPRPPACEPVAVVVVVELALAAPDAPPLPQAASVAPRANATPTKVSEVIRRFRLLCIGIRPLVCRLCDRLLAT
jgi:hypothetical protein